MFMDVGKIKIKKEINAAVCRTSSSKQDFEGDSPEEQKEAIEKTAKREGETIEKWFSFTQSASGELDTQPILEALNFCQEKLAEGIRVKKLYIRAVDRFTRGGVGTFDTLCAAFSKTGTEIVDTYGDIRNDKINTLEHLGFEYKWSQYNPYKTTQLIKSEEARNEITRILTRMVGNEIRYCSLGYKVRPPDYGYMNIKIDTPHGKRAIQVPHPQESVFVVKMFELALNGNLTEDEICEEINNLGYLSRKQALRDKRDRSKIIGYRGGTPLTPRQLRKYLSDICYCGLQKEKWTRNLPIKSKSEPLVTVDVFNKVNKNRLKIIETNGAYEIINQTALPEWQKRKLIKNPLYPYKRVVRCPVCRQPLLGSASKGKSGKYFGAYHCNRGHYFRVKLKDFNDTIENFAGNLHFSDKFINDFNKIFFEEWEKREIATAKDSINYAEQIINKDREVLNLKEKMKMLTSQTTMKMFEDDIEKLLIEKSNLIQQRDKKETEQLDMHTISNYVKYYMEHLDDLLLGGEDTLKNADMLSLAFATPPTYYDLLNGTPQLSALFQLKQDYEKSENLMVHPEGLEPPTSASATLRSIL